MLKTVLTLSLLRSGWDRFNKKKSYEEIDVITVAHEILIIIAAQQIKII